MNVPDSVRDDGYMKRCRYAIFQQANRPEWMYLVLLHVLMHSGRTFGADKAFDSVLRELQALYPDRSLPQLQEEADRVVSLLASIKI
jgi:hypothetical protein